MEENQTDSYVAYVRVSFKRLCQYLPGGALGAGLWKVRSSSRHESKTAAVRF